jgi:hypothetical protein
MASRAILNLPASLWSDKDAAGLAANIVAMIKLRTSKGLDADGEAFKGYSKKPLYVAKRGARLAPKGGRPTRTGEGVFYEGGYRQYKKESRRRGGADDSAEVDLVLSGNMMNNLVVKSATAKQIVIGLTKHAQYGYAVNETREFLGLGEDDIDVIVRAIEFDIRRKLK